MLLTDWIVMLVSGAEVSKDHASPTDPSSLKYITGSEGAAFAGANAARSVRVRLPLLRHYACDLTLFEKYWV